MRQELKRLSIAGVVVAALCGCGRAESDRDADVAQGGTDGVEESAGASAGGGASAGAGASAGGAGAGAKLPADFCPEVRPMGGTTCGLNYNHPDAVCAYGDELCRCSSPDLTHQPPLWGCRAAPAG